MSVPNLFFVTKLSKDRYKYNNVRRWTKKVKGGGGIRLDIYKGKHSVEYNTVNIFELLRKYLRDEHGNKKQRPWEDAGGKTSCPERRYPSNGMDRTAESLPANS